jgi:2-methylisocitrate lyase-like PEP mutase family enzyme
MDMAAMTRPAWHDLLSQEKPLLLPLAHDALAAKLIERAGFRAYAIGGFPLVGSRYGLPDVGLVGLGEMSEGVRDIMSASRLPVLVDGDDGYGDVKNVTHTIRTYENMGAAAILIEDQVAPKRCGHMAGKSVVPAEAMATKLRAAAAARESGIFLLARTDARAVHGLDDALRRADLYLKCGADGVFIEAPESPEELARIGSEFRHVPQMANMLEGGRTPLIPPDELFRLGFSIVAYPTTLIFRVTRIMEKTLAALKAGQLTADDRVDFEGFKDVVGFAAWSNLEDRFDGRS